MVDSVRLGKSDMLFEKKWPKVPIQSLTANGTAQGVLTVSDTKLLHVKQTIILKSNTQLTKLLQIKRVTSSTTFEVGSTDENIEHRSDVSAFLVADSASFIANEQVRPRIGQEDFQRAVYAEEPIIANRTILVDEYGEYFSSSNPSPALIEFIRNGSPQKVIEDTVDPTNNRPLPVKLAGVQGDVIIEADNLNLQVQLEGEYDSVDNPKPDSVGIVVHERGATQDRTKQTRRTTAKRGSSNTDTVSLDVAIHDHDGNEFTTSNPVPVSDTDTHTKLDTIDADLNTFAAQNHTDLVSIKTDIDSTNTKLDILHADNVVIEGKLDTGNASLASIDGDIDVPLSTRASESTLLAAKLDLDTLAGTVIAGRVQVDLSSEDIEIGAVELKDGTTDTRAKIKSDGVDNALVVTQNSQPLPTGAATSANQVSELSKLEDIKTKLDTVHSDLTTIDADLNTFAGQNHADLLSIKSDIDSTNTKLDTIHADLVTIEGKQDTGNSSLASIDSKLSTTNTEIGATNETAPATDTAASGLNGRLQRVAQRLTTIDSDLNTFAGQNHTDLAQLDTDVKAVQGATEAAVPGKANYTAGKDPSGNLKGFRIQGLESGNSTSTPLIASATYRGNWFKWEDSYVKFGIAVNADVSGTIWIDFSEATSPTNGDESSVTSTVTYSYDPSTEALFREQVPVQSQWVRVRFANGLAAQSVFTINATLLSSDSGLTTLQLRTMPVKGQLAGVVRSIPAIQNAAGTAYQELPVASDGSPKVYVTHIQDDVLIEPLSSAKATQTVVGTAAVQIDASPLTNRRVVNVTNDGPGRIGVGHSSSITFDSGSIRIPVGASRTFGIDETLPLWAIVENSGGSQSTLHRSPGAASGTAANPSNATSSNNSYADITAAAQTINANTYTAGTTNPLVAVRLGIEGKKQSGQTETVAFVNNVTGNAGNVGSVVTGSSVTNVSGRFYLAAISRENGSAVVTGVTGMGLTWTQVTTQANGTSRAVDVWRAFGDGVTTGTVTASFDRNSANSHIAVSSFSNVDTTTPVQGFASATGNSSSPATAAISSTNKGMSYLAVCMDNHSFSAGSGYTLISTETTPSGSNRDGLGTERKALVSTGTETPTGTIDSSVQWAAIGLTMTPLAAADPIVTLSYTLSAVAGATSGNITFTSTSDTTFTVDVTGDRSWVVADIPNVAVIATGLTIGGAAANIDEVYLELVDSTGAASRVSVWQGAKAVS